MPKGRYIKYKRKLSADLENEISEQYTDPEEKNCL